MATLTYRLNQSLDGFVDHLRLPQPCPVLFRHFIEQVRGLTGSLHGRGMYELMRYWDSDDASWDEERREYARVWRHQPKWVVSRSREVGPNATLLEGDLEAAVRALKAQHEGEIQVGGPVLAHSLTQLGLIDQYQLYVHPAVLGDGPPFFAGPCPPLRLLESEQIGERVVRLTYAPAG